MGLFSTHSLMHGTCAASESSRHGCSASSVQRVRMQCARRAFAARACKHGRSVARNQHASQRASVQRGSFHRAFRCWRAEAERAAQSAMATQGPPAPRGPLAHAPPPAPRPPAERGPAWHAPRPQRPPPARCSLCDSARRIDVYVYGAGSHTARYGGLDVWLVRPRDNVGIIYPQNMMNFLIFGRK